MASPDNSPPGPQGSSRATGGFMCGCAHGIALNIADFDSPDQSPIHSEPLMGRVCVYKFLSDPSPFTMQHEVLPTLSPILRKLARRYSPIRSKHVQLHS